MAVRKFKPVTPGTRHKIIGTFDEITTNVPEKSLVSVKKSSGGRNNTGKMTTVNDLSRGCSIEDVYRMIAITANQAIAAKANK